MFAYIVQEMPGIYLEIMVYKLAINLLATPVNHKRKYFEPNKRQDNFRRGVEAAMYGIHQEVLLFLVAG